MLRHLLSGILVSFPVIAQAQVEIAPYVAVYSPTSGFSVNALPGSRDFGFADAKQQVAVAIGGSVRYWTDPRFGLELTVAHGSSDIRISQDTPFTPDTSLPASITMVGLAGLFRFSLGDLPNPLWFEAGAIRIRRTGRAFRGYEVAKPIGASTGVGTSLPLTDWLRADFGFKALIYQFSVKDSLGTLPGGGMQLDLLARLGIAISFGRVPE